MTTREFFKRLVVDDTCIICHRALTMDDRGSGFHPGPWEHFRNDHFKSKYDWSTRKEYGSVCPSSFKGGRVAHQCPCGFRRATFDSMLGHWLKDCKWITRLLAAKAMEMIEA